MQKECEEAGVKAVLIKADMTNTSEARRAVKETIELLGGIDIVLANAVSVTRIPSSVCEVADRSGLDQVLRLEGP